MDLPALGATIAGKYRLEGVIGEGGMGRVYRARHELMHTSVAIKVLRPSRDVALAKARFVREAQAAARIRHPNVVRVYDVGIDGELFFMVMDLLEGAPFSEVMVDDHWPLLTKVRLLLGAMRGIAAAHEQGIIHRDIKPENVFVTREAGTREEVAKVLDFGISKLGDEAANVTESGIAIGTPKYMSTEQMHGARDLDARTDVYSCGVVLYETLTGALPFEGDTPAAIAVRMHTVGARPLRALRPELPAVLEHVVMKAMALRRDQRYASMEALIDAVEAALGDVNPLASSRGNTTVDAMAPTTLTPTTSKFVSAAPVRNKKRYGVVIAVGGLVAAGALAARSFVNVAPEQRAAKVFATESAAGTVERSEDAANDVAVALPAEVTVTDAGLPHALPVNKPRARHVRSAKIEAPAAVAPPEAGAPKLETPRAPVRAARGLRSGELRPDDL